MPLDMEERTTTRAARTPVSTYRLQFNADFTFAQARALVDYLDELGITDCYSSPVLKARRGSVHGYDVVDHAEINPEMGGEAAFVEFAEGLRARSMGLVMDVVPNHMCIASTENRWWQDLLENGPGSPFARFFDVDWNPPEPSLKNKVLLPILGDQFGRVIERQEIKIIYRDGAFFAVYYETQLPVAPRTSVVILEVALEALIGRLSDSHADVIELESILTALKHLPTRTEIDPVRVRERRREKEVARRRLSNLLKESGEVRGAVHEALARANGIKGRAESFDLLEKLLSEQAYRLSYWRVASDEINYRRFFDINELAAVRVEERPVFASVHEIIFRLMRRGLVTGLRIDHVDGLFNPEKYLQDLMRECASIMRRTGEAEARDREATHAGEASSVKELPCYIVVEKILGHDELLRREWATDGTTGYEFMNLLGGLFVDQRNAQAVRELYSDFTGVRANFADLLYRCKKLILDVAMSSELHVLARRLDRISEQHRHTRDFTFNSLHAALSEVIACFPVYRTYIRRSHSSVSPDDRLHINAAVRSARRRNPSVSDTLYDFIQNLLLLEDPKGISAQHRAERRDFVMRFQQLTSPVMAKGLEDTVFYRYHPLSSLNEVGGEPAVFGVSLERFHQRNQYRQENWPKALSATSTHDTKRGEDVRARVSVLSEIPEEWNRAIHRWREMNRAHKSNLEGALVPSENEEYLLYQTLVGAWPFEKPSGDEHQTFIERIQQYMTKALKEAKLHTSWINPNGKYEQAVSEFVSAILNASQENRFLADFVEFQKQTARAGIFNSLSQVLLKTTVPGVPDFYQGTEIWQLTLVDPDNRRPIDYASRQRLLESMRGRDGDLPALVDELVSAPEDGRIKLYLTTRALNFRRDNPELFERGEYTPLGASGARNNNVVAFARAHKERAAVVIAGRFYTQLMGEGAARLPTRAQAWGDTSVALEGNLSTGRYRDVFTGLEFEVQKGALRLADVFAHLPLALLERI